MRVIAGTAKRHKLQSVPGDSTRPITDRAKEALFSILDGSLPDARVLDLFAGTGAVGIEALSRGSAFAYFIERNPRAIQTIRANLQHCRLTEQAHIEHDDSFAFLRNYQGEPFDLIYIAPPQYRGLWLKTLQLVDSRPQILAADGTVVAQIHPKEDAPLVLQHLTEYDRRRYGSVLLLFYASLEEFSGENEKFLGNDKLPDNE